MLCKSSSFAPWHGTCSCSKPCLHAPSTPLPLAQAAYRTADEMLRTAVRGSQAIRVMAPLVGAGGSTPPLPPGFDTMLDTWTSDKALTELIANFEVRLQSS